MWVLYDQIWLGIYGDSAMGTNLYHQSTMSPNSFPCTVQLYWGTNMLYTHCKPHTQIKTGEVKRGHANVLTFSSFALACCLREAHGNSFWGSCSIVPIHSTIPTENPLQTEPGRPGQMLAVDVVTLYVSHWGKERKQLLKPPHTGSDKQIKCLDKMSTLKNPFGLFAQHSWVC